MMQARRASAPAPDLNEAFKAAMRQQAATVSLVTSIEDGVPHGMTATSVTSLSAEPPSVLVCINRSASMHGPTFRSGHFCINMLSLDQAELCREFSTRKGVDRFAFGEWSVGLHDLPFVVGAAAVVFCEVEGSFDYATHTIFIGRVASIEVDPPSNPLVYQAGRMGAFLATDERRGSTP